MPHGHSFQGISCLRIIKSLLTDDSSPAPVVGEVANGEHNMESLQEYYDDFWRKQEPALLGASSIGTEALFHDKSAYASAVPGNRLAMCL